MNKPPGTYSKFPGIISKRPPLDEADYCEQCHEAVDPKIGLYEYGKRLICKSCYQRHQEDSLEREERRHEASVRYDRELRDRKNR